MEPVSLRGTSPLRSFPGTNKKRGPFCRRALACLLCLLACLEAAVSAKPPAPPAPAWRSEIAHGRTNPPIEVWRPTAIHVQSPPSCPVIWLAITTHIERAMSDRAHVQRSSNHGRPRQKQQQSRYRGAGESKPLLAFVRRHRPLLAVRNRAPGMARRRLHWTAAVETHRIGDWFCRTLVISPHALVPPACYSINFLAHSRRLHLVQNLCRHRAWDIVFG